MERNMDLMRDILLQTEKSTKSPLGWVILDLPEYKQNDISYNVVLLGEVGFLEVQNLTHMGPDGYKFSPKRLTYKGHEYLDNIRDPEIWRKTKEGASKIGGFSLDLLAGIAKGLIKQKISQVMGIDLDS